MMADGDDDLDFDSTQKSSKNLGSLFGGGEPTGLPSVASTAYVPPKQPKKDSAPRVMITSVIQAFFYGVDQKWTSKGKMGAAILSTDNIIFQLILYLSKAQQVTSIRLLANTVFTPQSNNYLSFKDDTAQNWSMMFETKQAFVDFALQIVLVKAFLSAFKFDSIIQDICDGEGASFSDHESVEILLNTYKLLENGTIQSTDSGEVKPSKYKVGKNQNGKAFDDIVRGMKKNGQRVAIIGTTLYNIEITRVKRDKERASSVNVPSEEAAHVVESKRPVVDEHESHEKAKLLQRIVREGGQQMFIQPNQSSAFINPHSMHQSDDDSIIMEFQHANIPTRTVSTPVQFVQPVYHHPMHPQAMMQQPNLYAPHQQPTFHPQTQQLHNYTSRPNSSMNYPQMPPMYPHSQYPGVPPNVPPTDPYYQQPQQPQQPQPHVQDPNLTNDLRPILNRISDKVDALNDKLDSKNPTSYPNMETSILLSNIERIIKENETVKKELFDRSSKVEDLNQKISALLDRNQRLIEQTHQTAERSNVVVNNVSEQSAQKILELEKQKVDLTNSLSSSTSKIADLQLQLNQFNQNQSENQTKVSSLLLTCEQLRLELQKAEHQRMEFQTQYETTREQYKNEKQARKQVNTSLSSLEEEFNELKTNYTNLQKANNDRKSKIDGERRRWQNEFDEQKQIYESELDELRNKLKKQRATDNANNNQEISRIEQDLQQEWQQKFDKQHVQHEKLLNGKVKELEELKSTLAQTETRLEQSNQTKQEIEEYKQLCDKLQERCQLMKEKILEMNDEQAQTANEQIKRTINIIFQQLRARIQPRKQYSGEIFLDKALQIIKKATLKVLSNEEDDDDDEDEDEDDNDEQDEETDKKEGDSDGQEAEIEEKKEEDSDGQEAEIEKKEEDSDEQEAETEKKEEDHQPDEEKQSTHELTQDNSIEQQTVNEDTSSSENNARKSSDSETSISNQKNGWDTVDDLPQQQNQIVTLQQQSTQNIVHENQTTTSIAETNLPEQTVDTKHKTDYSADTVEENEEKPTETPEVSHEKYNTDHDDDSDDELFKSVRLPPQDHHSPTENVAPKPSFSRNIPSLPNPDDSDDDLFK